MSEIKFIQIEPQELAELITKGVREELEKAAQELSTTKQPPKEFLSRQQTAEYFEVSLVCIHDWCKKGILHPYKMGNRTYFKREELVTALLNSNKRRA